MRSSTIYRRVANRVMHSHHTLWHSFQYQQSNIINRGCSQSIFTHTVRSLSSWHDFDQHNSTCNHNNRFNLINHEKENNPSKKINIDHHSQSNHSIKSSTNNKRIHHKIPSIHNNKNVVHHSKRHHTTKKNQEFIDDEELAVLNTRSYGFCFLGAPGVGKGTYSTRIAHLFNAQILPSGDLIRACAKANENSVLGKQLNDCIVNGQLVPDDIVIPLVIDYLRVFPYSFILDGFPRTITQARRIHSEYSLDCVIYFKLPDRILVEKMLGRRMCPNCGNNYNVADINEGEIVMPSLAPKQEGICDDCGNELITRPDDNEKTIRERLQIYHDTTTPIERFYRESGVLLEYNVKKGIDDIPDIVNKMKHFLAHN